MLPMLGIIISVLLLITLAYRGWNIAIAAPLCAFVAMIFSGAPLIAGYTEIFMPALGNFAANYFPIFLTGAIFGRLMTITGYAERIAQVLTRWLGSRFAILATVLSTAILTYGGVSSFVVVFAAYPLARELFRQAQIPRRLIPASLMLGLATFTMSAIPGTPQVQNIIPSQFFGTTTFAAPVLGLIGGALIFGLGMLWLEFRVRSLRAKGELFELIETKKVVVKETVGATVTSGNAGTTTPGGAASEPTGSSADASENEEMDEYEAETGSKFQNLVPKNSWLPFLPLVAVIVMNYLAVNFIIPAMDTSYLGTPQYRNRTLSQVQSTWAVLIAMMTAILLILAINFKHIKKLASGFAEGVRNSTLPLINTGSEVGYGAVIASLAVFTAFQNGIFDLIPNALVSSVVLTAAIAGITASATGGVTIALNTFGERLVHMANEQGISLEVMHRLTAMAAGSFDTLPHNGAVIVVLLVTGLTHRQAYKDIAMVTVVVPLAVVALLVPIALAM